MAEIKRLRLARTPPWSAEKLAAAMAEVGVPWTRDAVVNLETGRRKRLAAHELLALAYVLDVPSPVELLAPAVAPRIPVTPTTDVATLDARAWCWGQIGPLAEWLAAEPYHREAVRMRWQRANEELLRDAQTRLRAAQAEYRGDAEETAET